MDRPLQGTNFCIGEYVTFICNLPGVQNFKWKLPGFIEGADGAVVGNVPTVTNIPILTLLLLWEKVH